MNYNLYVSVIEVCLLQRQSVMDEQEKIPDYRFVIPSTLVKSAEMIKTWEKSDSYFEYLGFILAIGDSVKGRKIKENIDVSDKSQKVLDLLSTLKQYINDCSPIEMKTRYGNPAYRDWYEKLESSADELLENVVGDEIKRKGGVAELIPYLLDSFGNKTRIDYGTGHEMAFVMLLCALFKIGVLTESDKVAVGLKVFSQYMDLVRELQTVYRMEPAGSMGVWNLDDYQFVSFIWGAAQLSTDKERIKPKSISDPDMAEMLSKDNHFFACLSYINKVKTGPFHEHSNQLWNISGVPLWSKVYTGLVKMYRAEVLCKFPVIQHVQFGSVFTLEEAKAPSSYNIQETDPGQPRPRPPMPGVDSPRQGPTIHPSRGPRPDLPPGLGLGTTSMLPSKN